MYGHGRRPDLFGCIEQPPVQQNTRHSPFNRCCLDCYHWYNTCTQRDLLCGRVPGYTVLVLVWQCIYDISDRDIQRAAAMWSYTPRSGTHQHLWSRIWKLFGLWMAAYGGEDRFTIAGRDCAEATEYKIPELYLILFYPLTQIASVMQLKVKVKHWPITFTRQAVAVVS
mmetsp:Transcript_1758/g.3102  ORF Transcript_1758/g.3102 Transcript_1758/m.3102 type:complete len:169 (-) Transcript_1758:625-1131(-)